MRLTTAAILAVVVTGLSGCATTPLEDQPPIESDRSEAVLIRFAGSPPITGIPISGDTVLTVAHGLPDRPLCKDGWFDHAFVPYELKACGGEFDYTQQPGKGNVTRDWVLVKARTSLTPALLDFTVPLSTDLALQVTKSVPGEYAGMPPRDYTLDGRVIEAPVGSKVPPGIFIYGVFLESKAGFSGSPVTATINNQRVVVGMAAGEYIGQDSRGFPVYMPFFIRPAFTTPTK